MTKTLHHVEEVQQKIADGKFLLLAGDEKLLNQLPDGQWIGGTIPYFMTEDGGTSTKDKIFVTELPSFITSIEIKKHTEASIAGIYTESDSSSFSIVIIPSASPTHFSFALHAPQYDGFATSQLAGWIAGVHLDDLAEAAPKVYYGPDHQALEDGAVVMHVKLPEDKYAELNILNIFSPGDGDSITFLEDSFSAGEVLINGNKTNFVDYIHEHNINTELPLVADYCGAMVNTSFQNVNNEEKQVTFYAPVFKGITYKIAALEDDYVTSFERIISQSQVHNIVFSCNCILNYLYSDLEGKHTSGVTGPVTFGEIAYQLVNQTLAYITIGDVE